MSSIRLTTELPGPRSHALLARREAAVPRGSYNAIPIFVKEAKGALIEFDAVSCAPAQQRDRPVRGE